METMNVAPITIESAEKCDDDMAMSHYQPLGGATSFREAFAYREALSNESAYYMASYDYRTLMDNILSNDEMDADAKAEAIIALTREFQTVVKAAPSLYETKEIEEKPDEKVGKRMGKPQVNMLRSAYDAMKKLFNWSNYEEDQQDDKSVVVDSASSFMVFDTKDGPRWLAYSSNSFEDLEGEIFKLDALKEAVEYADANNHRGPLRVFHVSGADIGDCDFQAISGKMLVEAGTFRDDELGKAALKYFKEHPEDEFQVSIGYRYLVEDRKDKMYDWTRIDERSVCPMGTAANPYTSFYWRGDKEMDERKTAMLTEMFGKSLAEQIINRAEMQTKALEDAGVANKTVTQTPSALEEIKALLPSLSDDARAMVQAVIDSKSEESTTEVKPEDKPAESGGITIEALADATAKTATALVSMKEQFDTLNESVKSITDALATAKKEAEERETNKPRGSNVFERASEQGQNLDAAKVKEILGIKEEAAANPVTPYFLDLVGR